MQPRKISSLCDLCDEGCQRTTLCLLAVWTLCFSTEICCDGSAGTILEGILYVHLLQWRHNGCDAVLYHQSNDCLLNRWFKRRSKKKNRSSASLAIVWGIYRWPVNSPHKWPVTQKMFPFDDAITCKTSNKIIYLWTMWDHCVSNTSRF